MPTASETAHQLLLAGPAVIPVLLTEANDLHRVEKHSNPYAAGFC
jgi:hypothetical protein